MFKEKSVHIQSDCHGCTSGGTFTSKVQTTMCVVCIQGDVVILKMCVTHVLSP